MSSKYLYLKAPVYYIDGIPAYKAGEWPGIKSNKFDNTRTIIHPVTNELFFKGIFFYFLIVYCYYSK